MRCSASLRVCARGVLDLDAGSLAGAVSYRPSASLRCSQSLRSWRKPAARRRAQNRIPPARHDENFHGEAFAYGITAKGEKLLRDRQLTLPFPERTNWKRRNRLTTAFTKHTIMVARSRITLEHAVRAVPSLALKTCE